MYGHFAHSRTASGARLYGALFVGLALLACPVRLLRAQGAYPATGGSGLEPHAAQGVPPVLHFCWTNCFTLTLAHGLYVRADGSDETWTIERYTPTSFVLHRHDGPAAWNGFSADVTYRGDVSNERLENVTVNGARVSGIRMAWGDALDTLPGSNAERDQGNSAQDPAQYAEAAAQSPVDTGPIEVQAADAPPPLPDEEQPPCPAEGYLWTPGYWAWGAAGYYWVRGAWLAPPRVGLLWTPGYWGFAGAVYVFHPGYWGAHVGYYGGINYGFGYAGVGFSGGRWMGGSFAYNTAVSHVSLDVVHNTYSEGVVDRIAVSKVSYNGGPGGTDAVPSAQERAAASEPHWTNAHSQPIRQAAGGAAYRAQSNDRIRAVAVTPRPAAPSAPRPTRTRSASPAVTRVSVAPSSQDEPGATRPRAAARQPAAPRPSRGASANAPPRARP